jgi:D-serine deaminase-like pyridoxal phosphate-dependent protein
VAPRPTGDREQHRQRQEPARRAAGTPLRVASKSIRVPTLISRVLDRPGFAGVMAHTLREALWLVGEGVTDDVLLAYPAVDRVALGRLVAGVGADAAPSGSRSTSTRRTTRRAWTGCTSVRVAHRSARSPTWSRWPPR